MRKYILAAVCVAMAVVASGCFEQIYISSAPDGTIAVCTGNMLMRVDSELTKAEVMADGIARAEYSPDGAKLLCILAKREEDKILLEAAICDVNGKVERSLEKWEVKKDQYSDPVETGMMSPRWSPDGKYVSYLVENKDDNDFLDLHVKSVSGEYEFTIPKVSVGYVWSPDSSTIALASTQSAEANTMCLGSIQVWDIEKKEKTSEPAGILFNPWMWLGHADGGRLVFTTQKVQLPLQESSIEECPWQLFPFGASGEGKGASELVPGAEIGVGMAGLMDVSADGKRISYVVWSRDKGEGNDETTGNLFNGGGNDEMMGDVFVMDADGTNALKVVEHMGIRSLPRWIGKGRLVVVAAEKDGDGGYLYVIEPDGTRTDVYQLVEKAGEEYEKAKEAKAEEKKAE